MKVACIGELVVDFIATQPAGSIAEAVDFQKCAGGSPANVAAGLHAQGFDALLVSKIGSDAMGRFLKSAVAKAGLNQELVISDPKIPTRCVFLAHDSSGKRSIAIANRRSADQFLEITDLKISLLENVDLLHIGGTTMLGDITSATTFQLVHQVKQRGGLISFDPNINLQRVSDAAKARVVRLLPLVDVLKTNEDEWQIIQQMIFNAGYQQPRITLCTKGQAGASILFESKTIEIAAADCKVVDVTGAGDAFFAGFLGHMFSQTASLSQVSQSLLEESGIVASLCAANIISKMGGPLSQQAQSSVA